MLIAGEASGDVLAAELVKALRIALPEAEPPPGPDAQPLHGSLEPRFFGAGGPRMAEAGVELVLDLTAHSVVGVSDVLRNLLKFKAFFSQLLKLANERRPDAIICVDYSGFNLRFAEALRKHLRRLRGTFANWNPLIIQYVSPQVWASRAGRAQKLERSVDLVLSIFPFEKDWYAQHAPKLNVQFVGHPIVDRYANLPRRFHSPEVGPNPLVVLLPGSRPAELKRHLPVMAQAMERIAREKSAHNVVVLPNQSLRSMAETQLGSGHGLNFQVGGLAEALHGADLAIASTGTVTMECAWFGVPTVALYKASWSTYQLGKRVVKVPFIAMPNLLAGKEIYPEFIQDRATADNLARAGLELLSDKARRQEIKTQLQNIVGTLGPPGASTRAARAIAALMAQRPTYDIKATLT